MLEPEFSCLGGKAAIHRGTAWFAELGSLGDRSTTRALHETVENFVQKHLGTEYFAALVTIHDGPHPSTEEGFEKIVWQQLQDLHDFDRHAFGWAFDVESDPASPRFGFSVAAHPFFVVGMHPNASRIARRSPRPCLAFNSHRQFDRLKADGIYAGLQGRIRARELRLQGSLNPNLAEFGEVSEARQYTGRPVGPDWRCPFDPRTNS
jgi:FPC/CPF motif-containing protein YcgG